MTPLDATALSPDRLAGMLRAWAAGAPAANAVDLLIDHDVWPRRADFRAALVDAVDDGWGLNGTIEPLAAVDGCGIEAYLATATCSGSDAALLRLAACLAGVTSHHPFASMAAEFDDVTARLVVAALARRLGLTSREPTLAGATGDRCHGGDR